MRNYYKSGTWNVICQMCGREYKSDEVRIRWDGLIVCKSDYEPRHILDFIRVHPERVGVPFTSLEPIDPNAEVATSAVAGVAIAGCFTPTQGFSE